MPVAARSNAAYCRASRGRHAHRVQHDADPGLAKPHGQNGAETPGAGAAGNCQRRRQQQERQNVAARQQQRPYRQRHRLGHTFRGVFRQPFPYAPNANPNAFYTELVTAPYVNNAIISTHVYGPSVTHATTNYSGAGLNWRLSSSFGKKTLAVRWYPKPEPRHCKFDSSIEL